MQITLVFPPFFHASLYNLPPMGLIRLASMLKEPQHSVKILDQILAIRTGDLPMGPEIYQAATRQILATTPELVAFSAQCTTYPAILQIASLLKQAQPDITVVVGGHNATFLARQTLERCPSIDLVIRGEGERTFPELVRALNRGEDLTGIAGLTWRKDRLVIDNPDRQLIADLNLLPQPDYHLIEPLETYRQACNLPRSIAVLEIGRGCPHECIYCSESALWQRRTRTYSVPRILDEMKVLRETHGAECFLLAYDQFTADTAFVSDFCHAVLDQGMQSNPWYCISRLDTVNLDTLQLMREAGCESMCYGIDSGSARTLAYIRKRIDRKILFRRVRETTDVGLVPTLSFVIGFPEETVADINATLELALQCGIQGNSNPLIQLPTVLPGTDLHRRHYTHLVREVDTYFALGLEFDEDQRLAIDEEMIAGDPEMFSSFWNLPCPAMTLRELDEIAASFPLLVTLFPKTSLLLCHALGVAPTDLWRKLRSQFAANLEDPANWSAADCYNLFPVFAKALLARCLETEAWPHLEDILTYEKTVLDVSAFANAEKPANIDLYHLHEWRPCKPANVKIAAFEHNLADVIEDLKEGILKPKYPRAPSWLAFRQQGRDSEVIEVNEFGRDLLELCKGDAALDLIAKNLQSRHGQGLAQRDFLKICEESVAQLVQMKLLAAKPEIHQSKGGEDHVEDP